MERFNEWIDELKSVSLPTFNELPTIPLYSDQVIEYVNGTLAIIFGDNNPVITNTMINNYVKQKMMPAPVKKRYSKEHIAYILTITILKQVISIPNIVAGIAKVRDEFGKDTAFDTFIGYVEDAIKNVVAQTHGSTLASVEIDSVNDTLIPMKTASIAFAAKLIAERSLESILKQETTK